MAVNLEMSVYVPEASAGSLSEIMNRMREWFDVNKVQPRTFKTVVSGDCLAFEVYFQSEDDAELFRQRFAA
jgi:hypothetical protein